MPYPFYNNPLNGYLFDLRKLRGSEFALYKELAGSDSTWGSKKNIIDKINKVQEEIRKLRRHSLPPRDFDIFLSSRERLVVEYEEKHPCPLQTPKCSHPTTELRIRIFRDNTKHVWEQCLTCGHKISDQKKSDYQNWKTFPLFDHQLEQDWDKDYRDWWARRNEYVFGNDKDVNEGVPSFDWDEADQHFKTLYPRPIFPAECSHDDKRVTKRCYKNGGHAVVEQCAICGKHCKSLPKSAVTSFTSLPPFDEALEPSLWEKTSQWHKKHHEHMENERERFYSEIAARIASGELTVIDNSKFGTYYESEEWSNTRLRILKRDDHECQSCGATAECVHHITYERLGQENDLDLISLCNECHEIIHCIQDDFQFSYRIVPDEIRVNVKNT